MLAHLNREKDIRRQSMRYIFLLIDFSGFIVTVQYPKYSSHITEQSHYKLWQLFLLCHPFAVVTSMHSIPGLSSRYEGSRISLLVR